MNRPLHVLADFLVSCCFLVPKGRIPSPTFEPLRTQWETETLWEGAIRRADRPHAEAGRARPRPPTLRLITGIARTVLARSWGERRPRCVRLPGRRSHVP